MCAKIILHTKCAFCRHRADSSVGFLFFFLRSECLHKLIDLNICAEFIVCNMCTVYVYICLLVCTVWFFCYRYSCYYCYFGSDTLILTANNQQDNYCFTFNVDNLNVTNCAVLNSLTLSHYENGKFQIHFSNALYFEGFFFLL